MAFTEFACRSGGSNLNAGTRTGDSTEPGTAADFTYASGSWVAGTGVFTVASGNPQTDGVAVGDFASVYADGSTVTGFIGRVTARNATTITVSLTAKSGTAPTNGTNTRTLKIGGAWAGPNAASAFPLAFASSTMTNVAGNLPRLNFKNDATYSITAAITNTVDGTTGRLAMYGYTSTYGDGGKAILDGGTSGASYILLTLATASAGGMEIVDFKFQNNGATGSADLVSAATSRIHFYGCAFSNSRGSGLAGGTPAECEAFDINQSNTAGKAAFHTVFNGRRLIAHSSSSANADGFSACMTLDECIADTMGGNGLVVSNALELALTRCDFYNNGGDGIDIQGSSSTGLRVDIENCNFVNNGTSGTGYGINLAGSNSIWGQIRNCGFGSGTEANTTGAISTPAAVMPVREIGTITYAANVTPWVDPANGDFRINLAAAQGAGRGTFTQTAASYAGAIGYPDVGAAQHVDAGGGAANTGIFQGINGQTGIGAF